MDAYSAYRGKVLDGRYKILEHIDSGGMANVFSATDMQTGQKVAIKMLKESSAIEPKTLKRFVIESRAASMFNHNNIVKIYDISTDGPYKYIVMEFIDGMSLKEYLAYKKIMNWRDAVIICRSVLDALNHAHNKGVVHRDIKPGNIMLLEGGYVKVTDFGIAKILDGKTSTLTANTAIGTAYYISPEQAQNGKIDSRCDIYSVGCMLYEMVTGKPPFMAETTIQVIMKQVNETPTSPSQFNPKIPFGLEQIILKALEKKPDNRFRSASQMYSALSQLLKDPGKIFVWNQNDRTPTAEMTIARTAKVQESNAVYVNGEFPANNQVKKPAPQAPVASQHKTQQPVHHSSQPRPSSSGPVSHSSTPQHHTSQQQKSQRQPQPQHKKHTKTVISIPKVILVFLIFFVVTLGLLLLFINLFSKPDTNSLLSNVYDVTNKSVLLKSYLGELFNI